MFKNGGYLSHGGEVKPERRKRTCVTELPEEIF
jgi:hypothetical protein